MECLRSRNPRTQVAQHVHNQSPAGVEARVFTYQELNHDGNHIRLLRILPRNAKSRKAHGANSSELYCELFHEDLDQCPSYKALSYTWGSESDPKHTIYLNGFQFEVRDNLWHALNRFQSDYAELVVWIDAICINQSIGRERNHQVAKMKTIYEKATEVIVWLGPSYQDSDLAIQLVRELYQHRNSTRWITKRFSKPDIREKLLSLWNVLSRDYWGRIWIVQELTVAKRIVFYCGGNSLKAKHLYTVQQLFRRMLELDGFSRDLLCDVLPGNAYARSRLLDGGIQAMSYWKQELVSIRPSFYNYLLHHFKRQASDPRDMIYGLAALANETSNYKVVVDYNLLPKAVFTNFAKLEIETSRKLDIITRLVPGRNLYNLPSWVPDWSMAARSPSHFFLHNVIRPEFWYCSAGQTKAVARFIGDGMIFKGVNIGYIELLGARSGMVNYWDILHGTRALLKLWELIARMDKTSSADHEAFIRVLIINRVENRNLGLRTKSEFLLGILGYLSLLVSGSNLAKPETSILLSYWKSYLALEKKDNAAITEDFVEADAMSVMRPWIDLILIRIWDRRFFISSSKAMGLASQEVIEGDIICIPLGCCHPVILRKVEDHYINLGEAYVDGYMYGEAMGMLEREELKLEDFELQ